MRDDELFGPPEHDWRRLAPAEVTARRISVVVAYTIVTAAIVAPLALIFPDHWWIWAAALAICVGWTLFRFVMMRKLVGSWAYAERDTDLAITRGLWFKTFTVVPYGRMQLVEVSSGPIMRKLGLAEVKLVTASPHTNATIPGLTPAEAARLRDKLTALGEAQSAGL